VIWRHMKELSPDSHSCLPNLLKIADKDVTDTNQIINALNLHYSNIANKYLDTKQTLLDQDYCNKLSDFVSSKISENTRFTIPLVSSNFVLKELKTMKTDKAIGLDGLNAKVLKLASPAIIGSLTHICNLSILTGTFPSKWKEARIVPIYKGGPKDKCANYRPISILPILSKILEKHVFVCMYQYLVEHNLLLNTQYGFRKDHSCQTALIELTEKIYRAIHEGKVFGAAQLDLSKAFDLVNHNLMIEKLKLYQCGDDAIKWVQSYLSGRTQCVKIRQFQSDFQPVTTGVPQGSILGPLLFIVYLNDLSICTDISNELLYADDTTLTAADYNVGILEKCLSDNVQNVVQWCIKNDMVLNTQKSKVMLISTKQKLLHMSEENTSLSVNVENEMLPFVVNSKILGVHFDRHMTWCEHIRLTRNKIVRYLYLFKQIKKYLPLDARKLFYNSYILPHFDYCCVIWGNCSKELLDDLFKLQKCAARIILDKDIYARTVDMFTELKWLKLENRIEYHRAIQMYKCQNNMCPANIKDMFIPVHNVHSYNTRAAANNDLHVGDVHRKCFSFLGVKTWNSIPVLIRNSVNINIFKKSYIHYLLLFA